MYDFPYNTLPLLRISVGVNFMPLCNSYILYTLFDLSACQFKKWK